MKFLSGSSRKLALLAPSTSAASMLFNRVHADAKCSEDLLAELQTLRGSVYLQEGAIEPGDLIDGRHRLSSDEGSWHLVVLDKKDRVCGCARYREYPNQTGFSQLGVSKSALAQCDRWGPKMKAAVEAELALSRRMDLPYVELGGWALDEQIRGTTEAFRMAIATYGLSQILGGAVGISTVTRRNGSASILKRIGGRPLEFDSGELPSYHDPGYKCEMEVLRFWSWAPNPRYSMWIDEIKAELRDIPVLTKSAARHSVPDSGVFGYAQFSQIVQGRFRVEHRMEPKAADDPRRSLEA
jgi:hypothetical protein